METLKQVLSRVFRSKEREEELKKLEAPVRKRTKYEKLVILNYGKFVLRERCTGPERPAPPTSGSAMS